MLATQSTPSRHEAFAAQLRTYLATVLHRNVELSSWAGTARLPVFLSRRYACYLGSIGDRRCLFAVDLSTSHATAAELQKHIALIRDEFDGPIIYTVDRLSANRRGRLIAAGISFAVPDNQLYAPDFAIDLHERFRDRPQRSSDQLSPVAQALLFHAILFSNDWRADGANRTPSRLAESLRYSAMSVGRAFEELVDADLAIIEKHGRAKHIQLVTDGRSLIERARPMLRSPARTRKYARSRLIVPPMKLAGKSALSNLTGLSPPHLPAYAIHSDVWPAVGSTEDVTVVDDPDDADSVIELWHYHPDVLSDSVTVDPLSLYAQFRDHSDERVVKASEEALEYVPW